MVTLFLAGVLSVAISFICSLLESVLYSTRVITLEAAAQRGSQAAQGMRALKAKVEEPLAALVIVDTMADIGGAAILGWAAGELWGPASLVIVSTVFTLFTLLVGDILPKTLGALHWRRLWPLSLPILRAMIVGLKPFIWLTQAATGIFTRNQQRAPRVSEDEILAAASLGARGGHISKLEHDLIANIIGLEEVKASDIMTPRTVMLSVDGARPLSEVKAEARSWTFSRAPVYVGGPEDVVGYLLKNELLTANPPGDPPVARLAKKVRFIPANANALNLLNAFLRRRDHLNLVVDEYGGLMGLITLEDVLETMVGAEIVDEADQVADMQALARSRGQAVLHQEKEEEK